MQLLVDDFSLTLEEITFLRGHLAPSDRVFEWGTGVTTSLFATLCRSVVSVEHNPVFAAKAILGLLPRSSVLHVPQEGPLASPGDDGDGSSFGAYVDAYTGLGITVVLIDGRARVACARRIAETAPHGPHPVMKVFLHDCEREEYASIFSGPDARFREVARTGRLMLLEPVL